MRNVVILGSLLAIAGCCGSAPDQEAMCQQARDAWAEELALVVQLQPVEFVCEEVLSDARAGEGQIVVTATQLLPWREGGRYLLVEAREYPLRRHDQGWQIDEPRELDARENREIPVGTALASDVDPTAIASADVELPSAKAAMQVPGSWFAGPWPDSGVEAAPTGAESETALAALLERQVCLVETGAIAPKVPEASASGRSGGILAELERISELGSTVDPHWLDPPATWTLFLGGGAAYLELTPDVIRINGAPVVALSGGLPSAEEVRGSMITSLYAPLQELADDAKSLASRSPGCPFHGRILVGADQGVPASTLAAVLYTAAQAQFGEPYLLVSGAAPTPVAELLHRPAARGKATEINASTAGYRIGGDDDDLAPEALERAVREAAPRAGLIRTDDDRSVGDVIVAIDALHGSGASCVMLSRAEDSHLQTADPTPALPGGDGAPVTLPEVVSVLPLQLPTGEIGPCSVFDDSLRKGSRVVMFPGEDLGVGASAFVGGVIGSQYGNQFGSGGLGSRGSGLGGGSTGEGLGGLGTKGRGRGASGYGSGGGYFGKKSSSSVGMSTGDPIILGALDKSVIDRVVKQHLAQIRYCYQKELNKDPQLSGKIVIKFQIAADGTVDSAETNSTTMDNTIVEDCICGRFLRFKFPQPEGGGIVIVSYPFVFSPD